MSRSKTDVGDVRKKRSKHHGQGREFIVGRQKTSGAVCNVTGRNSLAETAFLLCSGCRGGQMNSCAGPLALPGNGLQVAAPSNKYQRRPYHALARYIESEPFPLCVYFIRQIPLGDDNSECQGVCGCSMTAGITTLFIEYAPTLPAVND